MKATIVSKTLAPSEDINSHTLGWQTVSESVPSELENSFAFTGGQHAWREVFTDVQNPNILPKPLRNRRPERLTRLRASGEQPTGKVFNLLIPESIGRNNYAHAPFYTVNHPMEFPPPIPKRLGEALGVIVDKGMLVKERLAAQMRKIQCWADELQTQRVVWQDSLHPQVKSVIGHLPFVLYDRLLRHIEYEDKDYIDPICEEGACWAPSGQAVCSLGAEVLQHYLSRSGQPTTRTQRGHDCEREVVRRCVLGQILVAENFKKTMQVSWSWKH